MEGDGTIQNHGDAKQQPKTVQRPVDSAINSCVNNESGSYIIVSRYFYQVCELFLFYTTICSEMLSTTLGNKDPPAAGEAELII